VIKTERNPGTRIVSANETEPPSDAFFRLSFGMAAREIASASAEAPDGSIVAVVTPRTGETTVHAVRTDDTTIETLVVGRHDCADLVVSSDASLSLRHALVLLKSMRDHKPLIRILDLRSCTGLKDMRGLEHDSIVANGPAALRAAESALFVIPSDVFRPHDLLSNPYETFQHIYWMDPVPWVPTMDPEKHVGRLSDAGKDISVVSVVTPNGKVHKKGGAVAPAPEIVGIIQLLAHGQTYDLKVDDMSLRAGVLFGRYDRCDFNEAKVEMPEVISRVHALFLSMDERIHIFDIGSTHGLTYEGFPIRHLALPEHQPSAFDIMDHIQLKWIPLSRISSVPPEAD
jgi:hypothetical protein